MLWGRGGHWLRPSHPARWGEVGAVQGSWLPSKSSLGTRHPPHLCPASLSTSLHTRCLNHIRLGPSSEHAMFHVPLLPLSLLLTLLDSCSCSSLEGPRRLFPFSTNGSPTQATFFGKLHRPSPPPALQISCLGMWSFMPLTSPEWDLCLSHCRITSAQPSVRHTVGAQ